MKLDVAFRTDVGPARGTNEDAGGCFPELGLFVVADGMGGLADGAMASRVAVQEFHRHFAHRSDPGAGGGEGARLAEAAHSANLRIWSAEWRTADSARGVAGATVVALSICPRRRRVAWIHLGDSRLYRLRRGRLELLTADHTVAGFAYRGWPSVPLELPHTNRLVHALGLEEEMDSEVGDAPLLTGDVYLLCTDGVSGALAPAAILEVLGSPGDAASRASHLLARALAAPTGDNATLVLIDTAEA